MINDAFTATSQITTIITAITLTWAVRYGTLPVVKHNFIVIYPNNLNGRSWTPQVSTPLEPHSHSYTRRQITSSILPSKSRSMTTHGADFCQKSRFPCSAWVADKHKHALYLACTGSSRYVHVFLDFPPHLLASLFLSYFSCHVSSSLVYLFLFLTDLLSYLSPSPQATPASPPSLPLSSSQPVWLSVLRCPLWPVIHAY